MTISAVLDRPPATAALCSELGKDLELMAIKMQGTEMDLGALLTSYKILRIISNIFDDLYRRKAIPVAFIEQFLEEIESWKRKHGGCINHSSVLDRIISTTKVLSGLFMCLVFTTLQSLWLHVRYSSALSATKTMEKKNLTHRWHRHVFRRLYIWFKHV